MIVIADSGSTKADWKFVDSDKVHTLHSIGFNPVFHDSDFIERELRQALGDLVAGDQPTAVYFYGAGCWDSKRKAPIVDALKSVFPQAAIQVHHDLLGAARASCGQEAGIACILGTGSNSCLFDGRQIIDQVTNLGYLLGDEGSGTHLGKQLIQHYFYREMPKPLAAAFQVFIGGGKEKILDQVYGKETPNVYLASFTRFLATHQHHPFIQGILYRSFAEFIDRHVRKYVGHLQLPVHFIGSIAYIFRDTLGLVLAERGMQAGLFIKQPIERLVDFHSGRL